MILCYHEVDPEWSSPLAVRPDEFRRQCEWLAEHREVVPLEHLVSQLDDRMLPPPGRVALTFDDGFQGVHRYALPILAEYGWPATVFVVSDTVGPEKKVVDWVDGAPPGSRQTLTVSEIGELVDAGFDVQSHSAAHRDLTTLDEDECREDLTKSKEQLEGLLGRRVDHLAYPRGRHNLTVRRAAEAAGFRWAFSLPEVSEHVNRMAVPRVGIFPGNGPRTLAVKTRRSYLAFRHSAVFPLIRRLVHR